MADTLNITANVTEGQAVSSSVDEGVSISSNVVESTTVTANVATGAKGDKGDKGDAGTNGQGVPTGGTSGQILTKDSSTDYDTSWQDPTGAVDSVNGQTGVVVLDADDIDDTSTTHKFATASQLSNADSAVQPGDLATVATSGDYDDLTNKPTIPDSLDDLSGDSDDISEGSTNLFFSSAEQSKLSGIEAGAEVNTVDSVAGKTGVVTLDKGDVGLGNVDNTSDANKPISTATQTALNAKANDSDVVKLSGSQTIVGSKTFNATTFVTTNDSEIFPRFRVTNNGSGDAVMRYELGTARSYIQGIDNDDSDKFKIATAASGTAGFGGGNDVLTIETNGNITTKANVNGRNMTTDGSKLDGIETNADVTDATNVAAAGAVMEADTSTASMSFVVDEDDMASNSATKVPTQQSVKAYADKKGVLAYQVFTSSGTWTKPAGAKVVEVFLIGGGGGGGKGVAGAEGTLRRGGDGGGAGGVTIAQLDATTLPSSISVTVGTGGAGGTTTGAFDVAPAGGATSLGTYAQAGGGTGGAYGGMVLGTSPGVAGAGSLVAGAGGAAIGTPGAAFGSPGSRGHTGGGAGGSSRRADNANNLALAGGDSSGGSGGAGGGAGVVAGSNGTDGQFTNGGAGGGGGGKGSVGGNGGFPGGGGGGGGANVTADGDGGNGGNGGNGMAIIITYG